MVLRSFLYGERPKPRKGRQEEKSRKSKIQARKDASVSQRPVVQQPQISEGVPNLTFAQLDQRNLRTGDVDDPLVGTPLMNMRHDHQHHRYLASETGEHQMRETDFVHSNPNPAQNGCAQSPDNKANEIASLMAKSQYKATRRKAVNSSSAYERHNVQKDQDMTPDEACARHLQAAFDLEQKGNYSLDWDNDSFSSYINPTSEPWVNLQGSHDNSDEAYARQLQAELNGFTFDSGIDWSRRNSNASKPSMNSTFKAVQPSQDSRRASSSSPAKSSMVSADIEEAGALLDFGKQALKLRCSNCDNRLLTSSKAVTQLTELWHSKLGTSSILICSSCARDTCAGCGTSQTKPNAGTNASKNASHKWCCDNGRLFTIWVWLCAIDYERFSGREQDTTTRETTRKGPHQKSPPSLNSQQPIGIGYGGSQGYSNYLGYGSHQPHNPGTPGYGSVYNASTKTINNNNSDAFRTKMFKALITLLPSYLQSSHFDESPPELLGAMIRTSPVFEIVATLLRNDSYEEMIKRNELYRAVMQFIMHMANHFALVHFITEERVVHPPAAGLLALSFHGRMDAQQEVKIERSQPLSDLLSTLQISARKFQHRAASAEADFDTADGQRMLSMCNQICEMADFFQANSISAGISKAHKGKGKVMNIAKDSDEDMVKWHRETCVDEIDDNILQANYHYSREMNMSMMPRKGRMKHLMTEMSSLQSSLPEGIFVRHGASRLDIMKVLIVGPKGTPYEGGLFEFDVYCPVDYPQSPPMVQFKTTGGGRAAFNPNLYADGKVCLSLLGTWQGQPWIPGQSTLLQVFVSIQGMIFCDEPWYNEPGRETYPNHTASKQYNTSIQALTIQYALTSWLTDARNSVWDAIIRKQFQVHGKEIRACVKGWVREAGGQSITPLRSAGQPVPVTYSSIQTSAQTYSPYPTYAASPTWNGGQVRLPMANLLTEFETALDAFLKK